MLVRNGNEFAIAYSTHVEVDGFQRFSIAHELGHFFSPGHFEQILQEGMHQSRAGFVSQDPFEKEADHFAAGLLMPKQLFRPKVNQLRLDGLSAIESMREKCKTSLTATAIQFTKFADTPIAIVLSIGPRIDYCFISEQLQEFPGLERPRNGSLISSDVATRIFNQDKSNIKTGRRVESTSQLSDWFGGKWDIELTEEVVGLGSYGRTLTVLTPSEHLDIEALQAEEELEESWIPRFKK